MSVPTSLRLPATHALATLDVPVRLARAGDAPTAAQMRATKPEQAGEFQALFVAIVAMLGMSVMAPQVRAAFFPALDPHAPILNWVLLALLALPTVPLVLASRRPLTDFGLNTLDGRQAALEGLAWAAGTILLIAPLLHLCSSSGLRLTWCHSLWAYPVHVAMQEFIARGVIQGRLAHVLRDRQGVLSVTLSALLFGLAHAIYGWGAIGLTFLSGLAFGVLYRRLGNLIGVTVLHTILGMAAFASGLI